MINQESLEITRSNTAYLSLLDFTLIIKVLENQYDYRSKIKENLQVW